MRELAVTTERALALADTLKALGHPLRLQIVHLLCAGPCRVGALVEQLDAPQAVVSQQLRILRMVGLVRVSRDQGVARYCIAGKGLPRLLRCLESC